MKLFFCANENQNTHVKCTHGFGHFPFFLIFFFFGFILISSLIWFLSFSTIPSLNQTQMRKIKIFPILLLFKIYTNHMSGTPHMWAHAYMLRVGGVSPWCGTKQICEGGIGSAPIPKANNTF